MIWLSSFNREGDKNKKCLFCEKEFEITNYHGGQNRVFCYECILNGMNKRIANKRRTDLLVMKANALKIDRGCDICGYDKCSNALEWHHIDSDTKINNVSCLISGRWDKYLEETEKCILVCANCHREIHYNIDNNIA